MLERTFWYQAVKRQKKDVWKRTEKKREMLKGDRVVDWKWRLCNMAFENGVVSEDCRSAVIFPLYKGKGEKNKFKNYKRISLLSVVRKIYAGTLIDRVRKVTGV